MENKIVLYKFINENQVEKYRNQPIHTEDGRVITNPTEEILREYGYKDLVETPQPETPEGYYRTMKFVDGDVITEEWSEPIPEEETNEEV